MLSPMEKVLAGIRKTRRPEFRDDDSIGGHVTFVRLWFNKLTPKRNFSIFDFKSEVKELHTRVEGNKLFGTAHWIQMHCTCAGINVKNKKYK